MLILNETELCPICSDNKRPDGSLYYSHIVPPKDSCPKCKLAACSVCKSILFVHLVIDEKDEPADAGS